MSIKTLNDNLKSGEFQPLYYFYGEEEYLKIHYFTQFKQKVVIDMQEFNVIEFDNKNFNYDDFLNSVNSYPVMSERKLVTVTDVENSFVNKEFSALLKDIPEYCTVVFLDTLVKKKTSSNSLAKAVAGAKGLAVEFKKPDTTTLVSWMSKQFKSYGKQIDKQNLYYILELTDNDMLHLSNEISKLCSFVKGDVVTAEDIDLMVSKSIETNRYVIADAFAASDYDKVFDVIDKLYKQSIDDIIIANLFYKTFNDMWLAKNAVYAGKGAADLVSDFKFIPYAAPKIIKSAARFTTEFLTKAVLKSVELDIKLKSTQLDKRILITTYITELVKIKDGKN